MAREHRPLLAGVGLSVLIALACGSKLSTDADGERVIADLAPRTTIPEAPAPIGEVADFERAFEDAAEAIRPSLVAITTTQIIERRRMPSPFRGGPFGDDFFGRHGFPQLERPERLRKQGLGSGIILDEQGHILTNNHVVA